MRRSNDAAIKVPDLSTAEVFYCEISGLQFGLRDQKRNWLFLRISGSAGMVVLQEDRSKWPRQHFAFAAKDAELERAAALFKEEGISIEGPVFHDWMPADRCTLRTLTAMTSNYLPDRPWGNRA